MTDLSGTLAGIPSMLDNAANRYTCGHVKTNLLVSRSAVAAWQAHPGTNLPKSIQLARAFDDATVIYLQEWHCNGANGCTSGNGKDSARRKCGAVATLIVLAVPGALNQFTVRFDEPPTNNAHGEGYVAPDGDAKRSTIYQTKVLIAEAIESGQSVQQMIKSMPPALLPVGWRALKTLRRRYENQITRRKRSFAATCASENVAETVNHSVLGSSSNGGENCSSNGGENCSSNGGEKCSSNGGENCSSTEIKGSGKEICIENSGSSNSAKKRRWSALEYDVASVLEELALMLS